MQLYELLFTTLQRVNWKHWVPIGEPISVLQKTSFNMVVDKADKND